ncbi:MAG TPA: hypothetical protein ENF73_04015, partial [Proteobacteria bacterium]|nr:hypothetical protein [Pseudomonadota bacterium]
TLSLPVEVEVDRALADDPPEIVLCRFADGWDWTIKPAQQLKAECSAAVARGAAVLIIDHAYPDGSLDDEVYDAIGEVFGHMKEVEPWVVDTEPKEFAAVCLSERTIFAYGREDPTRHIFPFYGACRTLLESHIPFRVVTDADIETGLDGCEVLILPNVACLSDAACRRIRDFVERGGVLIATYQTSFFDESGERRTEPCLGDLFGAGFVGELPAVHYVRLAPGEPLIDDAPKRPIPLYAPTLLVDSKDGVVSGGRIVRSFPLEERQFVTHGFAPPGETTQHPVWTLVAVGDGRAIYFAGRICESLLSGDPDLRRLLVAAVDQARGGVPLRTDAPRCVDISWRVRANADILHLVNIQYPTGRTFPVFSPESYWKIMREATAAFPVGELPSSLFHRVLRVGMRSFAPLFRDKSTQKLIDFIDRLPKRGVEVADGFPAVSDVTVSVRKRQARLARVYSPFTGDLPYEDRGDGFIEVKVPKVAIHEIAVIEYA